MPSSAAIWRWDRSPSCSTEFNKPRTIRSFSCSVSSKRSIARPREVQGGLLTRSQRERQAQCSYDERIQAIEILKLFYSKNPRGYCHVVSDTKEGRLRGVLTNRNRGGFWVQTERRRPAWRPEIGGAWGQQRTPVHRMYGSTRQRKTGLRPTSKAREFRQE